MASVPETRRAPVWIHLLLIGGLAFPYFLNLHVSSLWDASEAFYAETPREMLESGDFLAPQFNYQPRIQKPPLTYWIIAASYKLFGVKEVAVRIPGALAAVGVLFFVYGLGRSLFNPATALLAVAILATTPRFFVLARRLPIDIFLLFWLVGTVFFLVRGLQKDSAWNWSAAYLFAGLGFMTKGPIALVIPALAVVSWGLWSRRIPWRATRPLHGTAILLLVILPWYLLIYRDSGWTYISHFFLKDNLGRFATEAFGPTRGPFYYVGAYFADFFPWSLLTVGMILIVAREWKRLEGLRSLAYGFPLVWSAVIFVLFSLAKNKQEYYIAPMYPMMALVLAATALSSFTGRDRPGAGLTLGTWRAAFLLVGLALLSLFVLVLFLMPFATLDFHPGLPYVTCAILLTATMFLAYSAVRGQIGRCWMSLPVFLWLLMVLATGFYLPAVEPYRPVKNLAAVIREHAAPEDDVGYYRASVPSMAFYLRRPIFEEFDADAMVRRLRGPGRVFLILTQEDLNYFVGSRDIILYVLDRRPSLTTQVRALFDEEIWARRELVLASNRPPKSIKGELETP